MRIQTLKKLAAEMRAVARGEIPAPADASLPSAESAAAVNSIPSVEKPRPRDCDYSYVAAYARDQASCLFGPELIGNLGRHWNAQSRAP